jgi:AcrR family transcriptional regulator
MGALENAAGEKWTPERRRQLTRDALVDAAAQVFARRGFDGASLDEIAETAGFTRGAIYKNFGGKEDLFFAVSDRVNEQALADFAGILGDGNPLDTDLEVIAARWRDMHEREPGQLALYLEFNLYALRNPEVRERVTAHQHTTRRLVADFIAKRRDAAGIQLRVPPEDLAAIFLITSDGFSTAAELDPSVARLYQKFLELMVAAMVQP